MKNNIENGIQTPLKYILIAFHDTNLSNILRHLRYFETYGYDKFVTYSSSLRFELFRDINNKRALEDLNDDSEYRFRINFDNEDIRLPFCEDTLCTFDEFMEFLETSLILDKEFMEDYCEYGTKLIKPKNQN